MIEKKSTKTRTKKKKVLNGMITRYIYSEDIHYLRKILMNNRYNIMTTKESIIQYHGEKAIWESTLKTNDRLIGCLNECEKRLFAGGKV